LPFQSLLLLNRTLLKRDKIDIAERREVRARKHAPKRLLPRERRPFVTRLAATI
jgi:hypothetical protein